MKFINAGRRVSLSGKYMRSIKKLEELYPDITPCEISLCACLLLNISNKEIAALMNISTRGVEISQYFIQKNWS